ncbi:DUF2279 domain-containing protein [Cytophaga hutchinsonii]|jgi:hypothetical protein|uniref:DUF2279 domain-containing protein n=1 Tax=Cytophaga hutchinsonii (strain ATCC 33406 / DSM 1761 / CIP 103989 / NBRC 15051 / NCIMB 9469 / D465) TaxID=269798 RepID=A0A6N4SSC1_CYTH3|nr:DUF2279 domain-containing protein [Cytophaga hutchinsonii]ABG59228.1 hypothetical protein CHU_1962 [Cytophaga hutchinsonii ATCC 33406]SFX33842.1 Predicted lipoprotein [Cytophaga hutchinsonii ATCC 33406]
MNNVYKHIICLLLILCLFNSLQAQDSVIFKKQRFIPIVTLAGATYVGSMYGLYQSWYKDYPSEHFHFFNDNSEWMQMDKAGHYFTSFQLSRIPADVLSWTGTKRKRAIWYGTATGFVFQSTIEVFDGFSSEWGFSLGDMTANTLGCATLLTQYLAWNELRIIPKFSYHHTSYSSVSPDLLGDTPIQQLLKDYNGQTYWLSFNIRKLTQQDFFWPKWLCASVGYGADAMVRGNISESNSEGYYPYRQVYLSLDIDFQSIRTRSKFLKTVFYTVNLIKVPMPTLEFNKHGLNMHGLYF